MYTYKALENDGTYGPFTGNFDTVEEAEDWYNKHGHFHEHKGVKLKLYKGSKQFNQEAL